MYLTTYYTAGNVLKDDDATPASVINCYSNANYPLRIVFDTKGVDGIYTVGTPESTPHVTSTGYIYAYTETVPIEIYTIDKTGITGTILRWRMENELRRIVETYPYGSYRTLQRMSENEKDMGGWKLYSVRYMLTYKRAKEDYAPTAPAVSYGDDWIYEGDTLTEGDEGTWTLTQGDGSTTAQAINEDLNLVLTCTVFSNDSYTKNGTSIALSTTVYTKVRFRYKTTGNATAKIVAHFSDATTQTVLSETASSTFTTATVTLTTAKTLQYFALYQCDNTGTVEYDFIQVYKATYILPNATALNSNFTLNDALLDDNGQGEITQPAGSHLREVRVTCDLKMEPTAVTWKRPQATTPKTDYNNEDVLKELWHYGGDTHLWHWFDLGDPTDQFKARLVELQITADGEVYQAEMLWREYRHGGQETLTERFGLSL